MASAASASEKELVRKSELKLNLVVSCARGNYILWAEEEWQESVPKWLTYIPLKHVYGVYIQEVGRP